jgi:hypothetical protein
MDAHAGDTRVDCNSNGGAATSLTWSPATTTSLNWLPPDDGGAQVLTYDTLRSDVPSDFFGPAVCIESDGTDTASFDEMNPNSGHVFHPSSQAIYARVSS